MARRDLYLANANEAIGRGEFSKASELLWGAVTQEIKRLASTRGIPIEKHSQFFVFMQALAKERSDPTLFEMFSDLNVLHKNFYDPVLPEIDFPRFHAKALEFIERLEELLRSLLAGQESNKLGEGKTPDS